jgi:hypothetical protein
MVSVIDFLPEGGNPDEVGKWFEDGFQAPFSSKKMGLFVSSISHSKEVIGSIIHCIIIKERRCLVL